MAEKKQLRPHRTLARRIAKELFTNGVGVKATRLVLIRDVEAGIRDLGGWAEKPLADQIERVLDRELPTP